MSSVDLRGIRFRAYSPQFDNDLEDDEYDPVGPGTADITPGAIDLSCIAIRAWEQNDFEEGQERFFTFGTAPYDETTIGNITTTMVLQEPATSPPTTISISEIVIPVGDGEPQNTTIGDQSITEYHSEYHGHEVESSPSISEDISELMQNVGGTSIGGEDLPYGEEVYGEDAYGEGAGAGETNQTIDEVII